MGHEFTNDGKSSVGTDYTFKVDSKACVTIFIQIAITNLQKHILHLRWHLQACHSQSSLHNHNNH